MASPSAGTSTSSQQQQPMPAAVASAAVLVDAGAAAAPIGILRKSSNITNKASGAGDATTLSGTSSDGSSSGGTDPPGNKSQTANAVQIVTDKPAASVETAPPQPGALCDRDAEGELAALMTSASRSARRSAAAETSLVPSRRGFPPTLLRRLFLTECNSYCVDCGRREDGIPDKLTTFAAAAPTSANSEDVKMRLAWANVNYGTVLCGRCALQHLAVEGDDEKATVVNLISGQWTLPYVMTMLEGGNNSFLIFLKHGGSSLSAKDLRHRYSSSNKTAKMYRSMLSEKTQWALRARGYHTSTPRSSRGSGNGYEAVHSESSSSSSSSRSHHATERKKKSSPKTSKSSSSSSSTKARPRSQSVDHNDIDGADGGHKRSAIGESSLRKSITSAGLSSSKHGKYTRRHTSADPLTLQRDRDAMLAAAKAEHHRSKHATVAASNIEAMNYDYEEAHRRHLSLKASTSDSISNKKKNSRHGHHSSQPRLSGAPTRHADGRLIVAPPANIPLGVSIPHSSGGSQGSTGRRREREVMSSSLRESSHHSHSPPPSMLRGSTYHRSLSSPDAPEGGIFLGHASVGNFGEASLANLDYHRHEKPHHSSGSKLQNGHKSMSSMQYLQQQQTKNISTGMTRRPFIPAPGA